MERMIKHYLERMKPNLSMFCQVQNLHYIENIHLPSYAAATIPLSDADVSPITSSNSPFSIISLTISRPPR